MPPTITPPEIAIFLSSTTSRSRLVHRLFPVAVLDAEGWPHDLADDEILARLLTLNLARAAAQGGRRWPARAMRPTSSTEGGRPPHI
jgi:hypothetical protein